jgi:protein TonB
VHAIALILLFSLVRKDKEGSPEKIWFEIEDTKQVKKPVISNEKNQVVQTSMIHPTESAPDDGYLSERNQKLERQTVAKIRTGVSSGNQTSSPKETENPKNLSRLGLDFFHRSSARPDEPNWATPGVRPEDYIRGVEDSERTALNTREFKFYGYFERIRERLDRAWVPMLREKLISYYYSGRHLETDTDHVTKLLVVLNPQGEIIRVSVLGESGIQDLDSVAIASFNKAGPFPNPPKGIIDPDHEVKIPWDFILKT